MDINEFLKKELAKRPQIQSEVKEKAFSLLKNNKLPLKTETVIIMFIEDGDTRYRSFYKKFRKLSLEDKLLTLTFIMFAYSEDIYFSKSIEKEVLESQSLCEAGRSGQDILSYTPFFDPLESIKSSYDLSKRSDIPNLLSEKYKIR